MRGRRSIQFGSSTAFEYDIVNVKVLMCLPRVKTAIDDPCTMIEVRTRKHVIGQISSIIFLCGNPGGGRLAKGVVLPSSPLSSSARAKMATKIAPTPIGPKCPAKSASRHVLMSGITGLR